MSAPSVAFHDLVVHVRPCRYISLEMSQNINGKPSAWCWICHTALMPANGVELHGGVSIEQFVCHTCGRHWYGGERRRPKIAIDVPDTQSTLLKADENSEPT